MSTVQETFATPSAAPAGVESHFIREQRLFLLLSIFIGVISGLLVVSFRMAIAWLRAWPTA